MRPLALALVLLVGCRPAAAPTARACPDTTVLAARADSLAAALATAQRARRAQAGLVAGAEFTMLRYAKIVQRDPTQARFLVGWTRRAFDGAGSVP